MNCSTLTSPPPAGLISSQAFFAIKGELSLLFSTARRSPTTRSSSSLSIYPLRLMSKNLKICLRFSSGDPEDITWRAIINSLKSTTPSILRSYILHRWLRSFFLEAFVKHSDKSWSNDFFEIFPSGCFSKKLSCFSTISFSSISVVSFNNFRSSSDNVFVSVDCWVFLQEKIINI